MADMANAASTKPLIYDRLSFPDYNLIVPVWTPSGSCPLCLTPPCYQLQKPPETAGLFFSSPSRHSGARVFARTRNPEVRVALDSGFDRARARPPRNDEGLETILRVLTGLFVRRAQ